jgi:hypothetical protein
MPSLLDYTEAGNGGTSERQGAREQGNEETIAKVIAISSKRQVEGDILQYADQQRRVDRHSAGYLKKLVASHQAVESERQ